MPIKKISTIFPNNKNLSPLSEYSGTVLKLTKKDKAEIAKLESSIAQLECDIYDINKQIGKPKVYTGREYYFLAKLDRIEVYIKDFKEAIKQIKINRLNKQKIAAQNK